MVKSMTGFGKTVCEFPTKNVVIEVKSLNSKQLDLSVKLPYLYKEKDFEVRTLVSDVLQRGKIDVIVYFEYKTESVTKDVNKQVVKAYYSQLKTIADELNASSENLLSIVMQMPETRNTEAVQIGDDEWKEVFAAIKLAVKNLDIFRITEGSALEKDIVERIKSIQTKMRELEPFETARIERYRQRLTNNLEEFVPKDKIDANRFEQELIYFLEKLDITEEKVRLSQHCSFFMETIATVDFSGRKLGFISQEIGREINTIGSKSNDADMQKIVVGMKDELEKIKEQVLNVL